MKVGTGSICQRSDSATAISRMRNCTQSSSGNPCASTLVACKRSPPAGTYLFASSIDATTNRASAGDDNQPRLTFSGSVECNVSVANYDDFTNARAVKRFAVARAQLITAGAGQSNLCGNQIRAPQLRHFAGPIDCFSNRRCCI